MSFPKKLYKYESVSTQSLANLKNGQIYFSLPSQFNDPFDCSLPVSLDVENISLSKFRSGFIKRRILPELGVEHLMKISDSALLDKIKNSIFNILEVHLKDKGVSCFSSESDNLLMWSHYGSKHTGFCLEFDTSDVPFSKARKVQYVDEFPKLNVESLVVDRKFDSAFDLLFTKAKSWSYENEWRCIHNEAPKAFTYKQSSLTGVYFGSEMDNTSIEIICLIVQGQNPNVRFWKGKKCTDRFGLEFEEVFYTSYIKSKELQLI